MIFAKHLRAGVRSGAITCSIRIWQRPHVIVGNRYRMEEGQIEVEEVLPMSLHDITPELARASGFKGVIDLLKVAKHGPGENVFLIRFHYIPPRVDGGSVRVTPRTGVEAKNGLAGKRTETGRRRTRRDPGRTTMK